MAQSSAILAEGYAYSKVRGSITGYGMGSPDAFRPEPWRAAVYEPSIDDAYMDGVGFARFTSQGRVHVASYAAGLSYNARDFSYYINGNCMCHAGSELAPEWLGENYYCDSNMRGGYGCTLSGPNTAGCNSADKCQAAGCDSFFVNGLWYEHGLASPMWTPGAASEGFLCKGSRLATAADFPDRPFGSFLYEVPGGEYASDPIEARVMAGQNSGALDPETGEIVTGNEDNTVLELTLEVFGCALPAAPACGDGIVTKPEQCDLGTDPETNKTKNGFAAACSIACTGWNPPECKSHGDCVVPEAPAPVGQDFPGKQEVGSTKLPAWIPIADVNFDELFRDVLAESSAGDEEAALASNVSMCTNKAPPARLTHCPGNLKKYLIRQFGGSRYACAPPMATALRESGAYGFFVSGPDASTYAAFRGRIVTSTKGQPDAFFSASWVPFDFSGIACYKPGSCDGPVMHLAGDARGQPREGLDGRYVDGLSLTVGCEGARHHVFTLAAGTAKQIAPSARPEPPEPAEWPEPYPSQLDESLGQQALAQQMYESCWATADALGAPWRPCYMGNCACHGGDDARQQQGLDSAAAWAVPDFVGDNYYCDGGSGELDAYEYSNTWKSEAMFTTTATCAAGQARSADWWAERGGPGFFTSHLGFKTDEPLEVRVMVGADSYYENVAVLEVHLEACVCSADAGMPAEECVQRCDGTWTASCRPGYVLSPEGDCEPCPAGTYEKENRLCIEIESTKFVSQVASTYEQAEACPNNTRGLTLLVEQGFLPEWRSTPGGDALSDCVCLPGFYAPSLFDRFEPNGDNISYRPPSVAAWSDGTIPDDTTCRPCPSGAACMGGFFQPIAMKGYGMLGHYSGASGSVEPIFSRCKSRGCEGGVHSVSLYAPQRCDVGYANNSALCAECDGTIHSINGNKCSTCMLGYGSGWYVVGGLIFSLCWFPTLRELAGKRFKSLYISIAYVQWLGVYSSFEVPWGPALTSTLGGMRAVNLNLEQLGLRCYVTDYATAWFVQALCIPLIYPAFVLVHASAIALLSSLYERRLLPARLFMAVGWRPSRIDGQVLVNAYLPPGLFFLNMYYNSGISRAFSIFKCVHVGTAKPFLKDAANITCWEGEHLTLTGLAILALLLYLVGMYALYAYVLFGVVRGERERHGQVQAKTDRLFGFVYLRFEPEFYWWEFVMTSRKLAFNIIKIWIDDPLLKSFVGVIVMLSIMSMNLICEPFYSPVYDMLENFTCLFGVILMLIGMVVIFREEVRGFDEDKLSSGRAGLFDSCEVLAWFILCAAFILMAAVLCHDFHKFRLSQQTRQLAARAARAVGTKGRVWIPGSVLRLDHEGGLLHRMLVAEPDCYDMVSRVGKMLTLVIKEYGDDAVNRGYGQQVEYEPYLVDWLLDPDQGQLRGAVLADYVKRLDLMATVDAFPSATAFVDKTQGTLVRFLAERATLEERKEIRAFLQRLQAFHATEVRDRTGCDTNLHRLSAGILDPIFGVSSKFEAAQKEAAKEERARKKARLRNQWHGSDGPKGSGSLLTEARIIIRSETGAILRDLQEELLCETLVVLPMQDAPSQVLERVCIQKKQEQKEAIGDSLDESISAGSPGGLCVETREPVLVSNLLGDGRFAVQIGRWPRAAVSNSLSQLCVPIFEPGPAPEEDAPASKEEAALAPPVLLGVLKCLNKTTASGLSFGVPFDDDEVAVAQVAATRIATRVLARRRAALLRRASKSFSVERKHSFLNDLGDAHSFWEAEHALEHAAAKAIQRSFRSQPTSPASEASRSASPAKHKAKQKELPGNKLPQAHVELLPPSHKDNAEVVVELQAYAEPPATNFAEPPAIASAEPPREPSSSIDAARRAAARRVGA